MEVKYKVHTASVGTVVKQIEIEGQPAEIHQEKFTLELVPVNDVNYGTLKLVTDVSNAADFKEDDTVTVSFTVDKE